MTKKVVDEIRLLQQLIRDDMERAAMDERHLRVAERHLRIAVSMQAKFVASPNGYKVLKKHMAERAGGTAEAPMSLDVLIKLPASTRKALAAAPVEEIFEKLAELAGDEPEVAAYLARRGEVAAYLARRGGCEDRQNIGNGSAG